MAERNGRDPAALDEPSGERKCRTAAALDELTCERAGRFARDTLEHEASEQVHVEERARFARALEARAKLRRSVRAQGWLELLKAAAVTLLLCAAGAGVWTIWPRAPLRYVVEGLNAAEGSYLRAGSGDLRVRFSEGSELRLASGASVQIAELTADGARIVAHEGKLRARIESLPGASWSVEAGPYVVRVTGTEFSVDWTAGEGRLVVELYEGSVLVTGPQVPRGVPLGAGHRLVGEERSDALLVTDLASQAGPVADRSAPPTAPTTVAKTEDAGLAASSPSHGAETPKPLNWRERVAAGDFSAVVAEAESEGIDVVLEQRSLEDLIALADAARYAKRAELAPRILLAERKRFPTSAQATTAAFMLGRLAEGRGATGEALQWYARYRLEAPNGALAEEALGRFMLLLKQSGQRDSARSAAELYLSSYPAGAFARAGKEILGEP